MKRVEELTKEELKWLHDKDYAILFNGFQAIEKYLMPNWKVVAFSIDPFDPPRYRITANVEKIAISYENNVVVFEGWLSIRDRHFKKRLTVEYRGMATSNTYRHQIVPKHSVDELRRFMDMVKPGKNLKIELSERTIEDVQETLNQKTGGNAVMGEFFKLLSIYAESIENAAQSIDGIFKILQESSNKLEQNDSNQKDVEKLIEDLYDLQYKAANLLKESNTTLVQIMNLYSRLASMNVDDRKITA
ncbi:MAG: hypothetical protein WHT65_10350 [Pseudothermotoga sp.]